MGDAREAILTDRKGLLAEGGLALSGSGTKVATEGRICGLDGNPFRPNFGSIEKGSGPVEYVVNEACYKGIRRVVS